ncbi:hypothetical protein LTR56_004621 [Elasticomyces elasticus]|nr:hypothetical protein LTR56_004621 [Elasticomyces elasticus]KAK3659860.1 hypothetical protein LTR22_008227 [Elasticomyces elasticus]KAK5768197.1 hypothetical protein LTS12_001681 [Elasticomyces elasticus]
MSGGFILFSPPSSVTASTSTHAAASLPHPRGTPLRAGGAKESAFIRHVDGKILSLQRRFAKRASPSAPHLHSGNAQAESEDAEGVPDRWTGTRGEGYTSMRQVCKDIEEVVDLISYLISLALLLSTVVPDMPLSPRNLFRCLAKLDRCFASLIQGRDVETGETLPGFDTGRRSGVSITEKVRIRSLVERTRVSVLEAFKKGEFDDEAPEADDDDEDDDEDMEGLLVLEGGRDAEDEDEDSWDMQLARVYDRTVQELGDALADGPGIGIVTEKRG